jgi:hypothetical protein
VLRALGFRRPALVALVAAIVAAVFACSSVPLPLRSAAS